MKKILGVSASTILLVFGLQYALNAEPVQREETAQDRAGELRRFTPSQVLGFLKTPETLQVEFLPADLDGTEQYDYLVVAYSAPLAGGKLLVFKNHPRLKLVGGTEPSDPLDFEGNAIMTLEYVDDSGIPIVVVDSGSADGRNVTRFLFRWTGAKLVSMLPSGVRLVNSYFADPTGSGREDIINPPECESAEGCRGTYQILRLKNGLYGTIATSSIDPSGLTLPPGKKMPEPLELAIHPTEFNLEEVRHAASGSASADDVVLSIRGLDLDRRMTAIADGGAALHIARGLSPKHIEVVSVGEGQGKARVYGQEALEVTLDRKSFLEYLRRAQPTKAPEVGDVVAVPVYLRFTDGLAFLDFVTVKIR